MCGRYVLAYPPRDVGRRLIEDGMPVDELPDEEDVQQGYNIAPGNIEPVYRAIPGIPGENGPPDNEGDNQDGNSVQGRTQGNRSEGVKYVLQAMKWGLIPSWTKRKPDYGSLMKTINCRDDSLFENKGMWTSMKHKKRCIVVAQGFFEWLKKGNDKIPHFVKRKDGKLLCMAGLWDCAQYEGSTEKLYSYTVITTSANKQLSPLHHRMPVILENGSEEIRTWLSPTQTWNTELQSLLKPYESELEVYPVTKDVGNVRNNSPTFIIPLDSKDNKSNIKNFFAASQKPKFEGKAESGTVENNAPQKPTELPLKRERDETEWSTDTITDTYSPPSKAPKIEDSPQSSGALPSTPRIRSATSNLANKKPTASPSKKRSTKGGGTPRITNFFTK